MAPLPQDQESIPQASPDLDAQGDLPATPVVPAPQPSVQDFLKVDPSTMLQAQVDTANQKAALQGLGGIGDSLANRQGFGNFYLGQMNPHQDVSGAMNRMAGEIQDPLQNKMKLLQAYQASKTAQNEAADQDVTSGRSQARAQNLKGMLQAAGLPKLASTIGDGMTADQAASLERLYPQIMSGQNELQKTAMAGQSAKDLEAMREKSGMDQMMAEYGLKYRMGQPLSAEDALKLGKNQDALSAIQDLKTSIQNNQKDFGPVAGQIAGRNPYNDVAQDYKTAAAATAQKLGDAMSGGQMNSRMLDHFKSMLPSNASDPRVAITQLDELTRSLQKKHANDLGILRQRNVDLRGFDPNTGVIPLPPAVAGIKTGSDDAIPSANADGNAPQTMVSKGRTYRRTSGGWRGL